MFAHQNMPPAKMRLEDFGVWESTQEGWNECVDGEVFARAGSSLNHNRIMTNVAISLRHHLEGGAHLIFMVGLKLQVAAANACFYPDVVATCHPSDLADGTALAISHPWLIAEVLSDSTAAYDRGKKFEAYRQIDTLTHYLLVDTHRPHAELFIKNAEGFWVLHPLGGQDSMDFSASQPFCIPVIALFEGVVFDAGAPAAPV